VAGDPAIAARLAEGRIEEVPVEALAAGLGLPLHDFLGLELTGLRPVVVEMAVSEQARSLAGPLHGGAVATLIDVAANVAVATSGVVDVTRCGLVTGRVELDFHAQPRDSRVRARAEVADSTRRSARTRCTVVDGAGRRIASAVVTTRVLPRGGFEATGLAGGSGG